MFGKPEWFRRRKYTGWGFTPVSWQGWAYVLIMVLPIVLVVQISTLGDWRVAFIVVWAAIFAIDFISIMIRLPKDERDRLHEAVSERNALWVILTVLIAGIGYQAASSVVSKDITAIDPVILIAIIAGTIAKAVSNFYLDRKN